MSPAAVDNANPGGRASVSYAGNPMRDDVQSLIPVMTTDLRLHTDPNPNTVENEVEVENVNDVEAENAHVLRGERRQRLGAQYCFVPRGLHGVRWAVSSQDPLRS